MTPKQERDAKRGRLKFKRANLWAEYASLERRIKNREPGIAEKRIRLKLVKQEILRVGHD